jgi:hypothetical protein
MSEPTKDDSVAAEARRAAARSNAAAAAKTKADAIAKAKAESAAAAQLKAERKAYAARDTAEKAERCARALVVDTVIGWNPQDIIAVWAVCMNVLRSRTRVLIISSDEEYPTNPRHQLIQRVIGAVAEDIKALGWDQVSISHHFVVNVPSHASEQRIPSQEVARQRLSLIKTAPGMPCPNPGLVGCGFTVFDKIYPPETDTQAMARLPVQACNFMLQMKEEGRPVLWIGLGAMSNLRSVLSHGGVTPNAIVQMGGCPGRTEPTVQSDACACNSLLQYSLDLGIPLTFVTNDTGESPGLLWLDDVRHGGGQGQRQGQRQPLDRLDVKAAGTSLLGVLREFPNVLRIVVECTECHVSGGLPKSFEGASFLHAPLALLHALAPIAPFVPLSVVPACVKCDSLIPASICSHGKEMRWCKDCWGKWTVTVDRAAAEAAADASWWHHPRLYNSYYRDISVSSGDENNCSVTVGWMPEESVAHFRTALLKLLCPDPPV